MKVQDCVAEAPSVLVEKSWSKNGTHGLFAYQANSHNRREGKSQVIGFPLGAWGSMNIRPSSIIETLSALRLIGVYGGRH